MKRVLKRALSLPLVRPLVMRRSAIRFRLRRLLRASDGHPARKRPDRLRQDPAPGVRLEPSFVAEDRRSFVEGQLQAMPANSLGPDALDRMAQGKSSFRLRLFCLCCNETTQMLVDYKHCAVQEDGTRIPNWRERLVCPGCDMNNRQRLIATLIHQFTAERSAAPAIYMMEQVTPIYEWVCSLGESSVAGSEYLGPEYEGGQRVHGIQHEDVMALSYADESFDVVVSNDVLEHIPDPAKALRECFRVLKPAGIVLATIPFEPASDTTAVRARLTETGIEHVLPPQYHGNPLSFDGSLVFHDFGWDLLELARVIGFAPAVCEVYSAEQFGHGGPGLLVFRFTKPASAPTS